ncbi:MAG TPA: homoprotocatechuate degradation operon regulator HpaR [Steroidobacteraceae bacterium]|nr:homoprotocatechuate degradation operon regulator HpaR [Steroidobacteraceae bacterium]
MSVRPVPMRAFASSLPMALLRAREAVMRCFRPGLRDHGVTEQQWRLLRALAGHESLEITELAAQTCLLPPSVSRILPDLEARGLIARRQVQADLRRSSIVLTPEGSRLIAAHAPRSEHVYGAIEQRFGAERLQQLIQLLHELETAVAALPAETDSVAARPLQLRKAHTAAPVTPRGAARRGNGA